jgi:two-component system OmpR family sensor kinase
VRVDGEGSGLGLSIVDAVMAAHGGSVTVESELGKGATFTLFFPVEK